MGSRSANCTPASPVLWITRSVNSLWERLTSEPPPAATPGDIDGEIVGAPPTLSLQQTPTRTGHGIATGARVETGEVLHAFLSHLVQQGAPGTQALSFLHMKACGTVQLLHSLFTLPLGPYDDKPPDHLRA